MNPIVPRFSMALVLLLMTACAAAPKMDFLQQPQTEISAGKSIYLLSVNQRNTYKPKYQPKLHMVMLENTDTEKRTNFVLGPEAKIESEDAETGNRYLTHFSLEPGNYVLRHLYSINAGFPIYGSFLAPVHSDLVVDEPGVYYLGNLSAVVRQRQGNEFKAGSSIPLLDQSAVGASGGTFEIEISDQWARDRGEFVARYPQLQNVEIRPAVMPPFDRARAQKYWEDH